MVHVFVVGVTLAWMLLQYVECKPQPLQKIPNHDEINKTSDVLSSANITNLTSVHGFEDSADVTLRITDDQGHVLDTDVLPFGMDIKLKVESSNKNKTVSLIPFWCHIISVTSNRKYAILQNGCGDGLVISRTAGFIVRNGTGFSPLFRALDFSNDNTIRFSCNYVVKTSANNDNSCNNSSTALKNDGGVRSVHDMANLRNHVKGGNSYSDAVKSVETRVIGLKFPQQSNGSKYVKESKDSLRFRRIIFLLSCCGVYVFILSIVIAMQIDGKKTENIK